jgi:hypothetical protein
MGRSEGDHILLDLGGSASTPVYNGQVWDGLSFQTPGGNLLRFVRRHQCGWRD